MNRKRFAKRGITKEVFPTLAAAVKMVAATLFFPASAYGLG